jgi:predicted Rossmann-fold nucleotide-binding protein
MQTGKMPRVPIVLFGKEFWTVLDAFMQQEMLAHHQAIEAEDLKLYTIVDTAEEAMEIIRKTKDSDYLTN